ncbi:hypothetical protein L0Y59_05225, partial [Candidatus Uhrbacteria bacterium]|nr:hypothetical protein [Candidatus Uhrbacteria bacterium]
VDEGVAAARGGGMNADDAYGAGTVRCSGDFSYDIPVPAGNGSVRNGILQTTAGPVPVNGNTAVFPISSSHQEGDVFVSINELDTYTMTDTSFTITISGTITARKGDEVQVSSCHGVLSGGPIR